MPNIKQLENAEHTSVSWTETGENCAPWINSIDQCMYMAGVYAQSILGLARASAIDLSAEQGQRYSLQIQQEVLVALLRLAEKIASRLAELDSSHLLDVESLRLLRNKLERRLRLLNIVESDNQDSIIPQALYWFEEHGEASDLGLLGGIRRTVSHLSRESYQLLEDAERAIIWRASEKPEWWLEALRFAGPEEQLWLVTALISRVILQKEREGRAAAWGDANLAANALIAVEQQDELLKLLVESDPDLRAEVAIALGEGGDAAAVPALSTVARSDEVAPVRTQACRALGFIGGPAAVDALIEAALGERDLHALAHALNSLRHLLPTVIDDAQRARTYQALRKIADATDAPALAREAAAHMLSTMVETQAV